MAVIFSKGSHPSSTPIMVSALSAVTSTVPRVRWGGVSQALFPVTQNVTTSGDSSTKGVMSLKCGCCRAREIQVYVTGVPVKKRALCVQRKNLTLGGQAGWYIYIYLQAYHLSTWEAEAEQLRI